MGVARRRLRLTIAKEPADHRQAVAEGERPRGESVAEIVVSVTFRHDTSRNLDPALHTHSVIANMVRDADGRDAAPPRRAPASSTRRSGTAPSRPGRKRR